MRSTNPYRALVRLLPARPLYVGTVETVAGGVATIRTPDNGLHQARGEATIGQTVFFRDGAIEGEAETLPVSVIEI